MNSISKSNLVCLLLLIILARPSSAESNPILIDEIATNGAVDRYFSSLEDKSAELSIDDLIQGGYQDMFSNGQPKVLNRGYTQSAFWLYGRFQLSEQAAAEHLVRYFALEYSLLDAVDFYVVRNGEIVQRWATGDSLPFSTRPIDYSHFLFPLDFSRGEINEVYIRVRSTSSMRLPVYIWSPAEFYESQRPKLLLSGLYFGILLLMFFYNLCLFAKVRDRSYFYYISYIFALATFQLGMTGYGFEYLWPDTPQINEFLIPLSICAVSIFVLAFGQRILELQQQSPVMYYFFNIVIVLEIAGAIASLLLPYSVVIQAVILFAVMVAVLKLYVSIQLSFKGIYTAQLFLFAWFTLLCGAIALAATSMGWVPVNFLTANSFMIGSAVEVIVLSFILAERNQQISQAKAAAELQAKNALQAMNDSLRENNRIKDEFLATISHELRTPMNGVLGCLQHVQQYAVKEGIDQYLSHADRSARHMLLLIDSLLAYTELQSGDLKLQQEPFRIGEVLEKSRLLFADTCAKKNIKLHLRNDQSTPSTLFGDSVRISQIFNNLIDNAIKFTHSGEIHVEISCEQVDPESQSLTLLFSVRDTGIGIEPHKQTQIFESFRQVDGASNRGYGGLGIGLSVVKSLLERMDGSIECRSRPGQGSRFIATIPCHYQNNELSSRLEQQDQQSTQPGASLRVLVVEDNPVNQLVIKGLLTRHGYEIITASNGEQAIEELTQHAIDVVLMDCQMPIMDGFEATQKIRGLANADNHYADLPIIAVTANAMSEDRFQCINVGMNDYLSKPIDAQVLNRKIIYWANSASRQKAS